MNFIIEAGDSHKPELQEAFRDIYEAVPAVLEELFTVPSDVAIKNARVLLPEMNKISPQLFEAYPTPV